MIISSTPNLSHQKSKLRTKGYFSFKGSLQNGHLPPKWVDETGFSSSWIASDSNVNFCVLPSPQHMVQKLTNVWDTMLLNVIFNFSTIDWRPIYEVHDEKGDVLNHRVFKTGSLVCAVLDWTHCDACRAIPRHVGCSLLSYIMAHDGIFIKHDRQFRKKEHLNV